MTFYDVKSENAVTDDRQIGCHSRLSAVPAVPVA